MTANDEQENEADKLPFALARLPRSARADQHEPGREQQREQILKHGRLVNPEEKNIREKKSQNDESRYCLLRRLAARAGGEN